MKEFPSCFGENGVQVADSSSSSISWTKNLMGQGLSVGIDELEPLEGYYLVVLFNKKIVLLLGDLKKEACKKIDSDNSYNNVVGVYNSDAIFIAKREHIFGKKFYCAKAQFCDKGKVHDVRIECDVLVGTNEPCLVIRIDSKIMMQVKQLKWKFRGNQTILVDGFPVEVFWDVHNWLFGNATGNAVFMFQTCVSADKLWSGQSVSDPSLLTWAYSQQFRDSQLQGLGFSLILYAWKNE
ncbi:hypothetical protein TSUD_334190 [Trifolium subterraneum]|uniref:DUF868 domain-containing protein n=1 Tax=Trifolium subterraneum TaxID=3900 RepID=A0A2Z6MCZ0_TRISU|nr:hypothetical protein TSUD_334190 [Trifolium subterraneum]